MARRCIDMNDEETRNP